MDNEIETSNNSVIRTAKNAADTVVIAVALSMAVVGLAQLGKDWYDVGARKIKNRKATKKPLELN